MQTPAKAFDSHEAQNLIDWSLARDQSSLKVSAKSVHNFLRYFVHRQTHRQTDTHTEAITTTPCLTAGVNDGLSVADHKATYDMRI
jgi:hypothetical protein